MVAATPVITEDTPIFESGDGVLDPCAAPTVPTPSRIAKHASTFKPRCQELADAAIAAVGKYAAMVPA